MNLIDAVVIEVTQEARLIETPEIKFWKVDVIIEDEGGRRESYLTFRTERAARRVQAGYKFQH